MPLLRMEGANHAADSYIPQISNPIHVLFSGRALAQLPRFFPVGGEMLSTLTCDPAPRKSTPPSGICAALEARPPGFCAIPTIVIHLCSVVCELGDMVGIPPAGAATGSTLARLGGLPQAVRHAPPAEAG